MISEYQYKYMKQKKAIEGVQIRAFFNADSYHKKSLTYSPSDEESLSMTRENINTVAMQTKCDKT